MCGLVGIWSPNGATAEVLVSSVVSMARSIQHRGPDDSGVWIDSSVGVAIAHQRLSVLDLSRAGHQPMQSVSGRYVIAFNGEIYNHLTLRRELEQSGQIFRPWAGHSDTETLLAAIEAWGLDQTLERCAGMFSIALWDRVNTRLHLARDRFGEKPLYWGWVKHGLQRLLVFASDLAALRALPGVESFRCNRQALHAYFHSGCIPAPLCIYEGLQQLMPGHRLELATPDQSVASRPLVGRSGQCPVGWN